MPLTHFPHGVSSFGQTLYGGDAPTMGKVYHVRKTTDANYDSWYGQMQHKHYDGTYAVQTSIENALAVADDFDTIWVYPGQWKPTATLAITQDSLRLLAVQTGPNKAFTRTEIRQYGNVACAIISINDAHNVEVAGFRLTPAVVTAGVLTSYDAIAVAQTASVYGAYIHDNYFYNAVTPTWSPSAIKLGVEDSFNADSIVIDNNYFLAGGSHGASAFNYTIEYRNGTFGIVSNNTFICYGNTTDSITLYVSDEGTDTVERLSILDNRFFAFEAGTILTIDTGNTTDGHVWIDGNHFVGQTADANCFDYQTDNSGLNYLGTLVIDS